MSSVKQIIWNCISELNFVIYILETSFLRTKPRTIFFYSSLLLKGALLIFLSNMLFSRLIMWGMVVLGALFMTWCTLSSLKTLPQQVVPKDVVPQVCSSDHCRTVEVADEVKEQQRGLMNRTHMDEDAGMLFIFPQLGSWQFWMKDTLIPLDMLWLDSTWRVLYIASNVPPCTQWDACLGYWPTEKNALYVLELNAGQAEKYTITTGVVLTLPTP